MGPITASINGPDLPHWTNCSGHIGLSQWYPNRGKTTMSGTNEPYIGPIIVNRPIHPMGLFRLLGPAHSEVSLIMERQWIDPISDYTTKGHMYPICPMAPIRHLENQFFCIKLQDYLSDPFAQLSAYYEAVLKWFWYCFNFDAQVLSY